MFILANDVTINNVVDGNIFVCAKNLTLTKDAYVYSDLFAFAQKIDIDGYVYDVYAASEVFNLGESGYVIRNASIGSETVNINGIIRRDANIGCETLSIGSDVTTDALIMGNLNYSAKEDQNINENLVTGEINFKQQIVADEEANSPDFFGPIAVFIYFFLVILLLVLASSKFADNSEKILSKKLGASFGFGVLALIAVPVISIILFCTLIGIWAGLVSIILYCLAISICLPLVSVTLGKLISTKTSKNSKAWILLFSTIIALVLYLFGKIPFLGGLLTFAIEMLGFGIIIFTLFPPKTEAEKVEKTEKENNEQNKN